MASAPRPLVALLFVAAVLLLAIAGSAKPIEYQTLVLAPLSKPPPLVRSTDADDLSWNLDSSEEEVPVAAEEGSASLQLTLHHRDSLHYAAANSTPESLFRLRLNRDAARVSSLGALAAAAAAGSNATRGFSSAVVSGLAQGSGEYFTRIGIGTPPAPAYIKRKRVPSEVKVPTVVMHFKGGEAGGAANLSLPAANYMIPVDTDGVFCFAFAGTDGGISIIGNIQQQGFRVVFDGEGSRVGFAAGRC